MQLFKNVISLNQAAKISGYTQDYLGSLIRSGEIKGVKKGGVWFTTEGEITHYISKQKAVHRKLAVRDFLEKVSSKKLAVRDFVSHLSARNFLVSSLVLFVAFSSTGVYFFKKYDSSLTPHFRAPSFVLASTALTSKAKNISLPTFPTLPTFPNPFPILKKIGKVYVEGVTNVREAVESSSRDFTIAKINSVKEFSSNLIAFTKEKISTTPTSKKKVSSVAIAKNKIDVGNSLTDISDGVSYGWGAFIGGLVDNGEHSLNNTKEFASTLGSFTHSLSTASQIKVPAPTNLASVANAPSVSESVKHSLKSSSIAFSQTTASVGSSLTNVSGGVSYGWESFIGGIINNAKGSANGFASGVDSFTNNIRSSARAFLGITDVNPKIYIQEIPVIVKVPETTPSQTPSVIVKNIYTSPAGSVSPSSRITINQYDPSVLPRLKGIELAILNNISHNSVQTDRVYISTGNNLGSAISSLTQNGTLNSPTLKDSIFENFTSTGRSEFTRVPTLAHSFTTWPDGTSNASNATLYINPANSITNGNLIGASVGDVVKFIVDAEGNIYANSVILTGSVTSGATTVASLSVLDNTILGDAGTDTLTVNSGSTFNNNISQVGAYTFSTGTGLATFNGDVTSVGNTTLATGANKTNTFGTGTAAINTFGEATGTNAINGATTILGTALINSTGILGTTIGNATGLLTLHGATTLDHTFSQTGANTFSTGTSAVSLNGDTTIATGKAFTVTNGTTGILGATSINTSGSNTTDIGTGTNAGTITIGNITTGDLALNDANWNITGLGAANFTSIGIATQGSGAFTTLTSSGATTLATGASLTNTFGAGTGAINTFGNATGTNAINGATNITGATTILGTTLINSTGILSTTIGNATGTLSLHGATTLDNTFSQTGANTFGTGTGAVSLNGAVSVTGTNTFATGSGTSTFGGNILASTGSIDIGSTGTHFGTVYADNVTASNIYGTVVTGSTSANDWIINSDNATADTENMSLAFERGTITPNATLVWDATGKKFILNAPLELASTIGTATFLSPGLITATSGLTSNGVVTVQNNSNFIQSGTGTFSTGTGTVSLNGDTTIATGKTFTVTNGTTNITGATTILGTTLINSTGTSATTIGNSTGVLTLASGGVSGWTNTSGNLTIQTATSGTTTLDSAGILNLGTVNSTATNLGKALTTLTINPISWTATPTISGLITATSGLTSNGTLTVGANQNVVMTSGTGTFAQTYTGTTGAANSITATGVTSGNVLLLTSSSATASGDVLAISNAGTGKDISGTSNTWNITKAGAGTFTSISSGAGSISGGAGSFTTLTSSGASTIGTGASLTNTFGAGASSINTIGSATTPGALTLHGATSLDNTFTVSGTNLTSLGGNLTVTGTAWTAVPTISGLITATSGLTSNGAVTVQNNSNLIIASGTGTFAQTYTGTTGAANSITATGVTSGNVLLLTSSSATASGDVLAIANSGTGKDISGTSNTWNISKAGAGTFTSISSGAGAISGGAGSFTTLTSSGASTIGTGASLTNTFGAGTGAINTFGNATGTNAINGATTILGTTLINTTNTSATTIGNATGTLALAGTTFALTSGSGLNVTTLGALSGITTIDTSSTINSQTISAAASFTGTLNVATGYKVNNAATTGTILRGNGTNYIPSTATFADTYTASNLLYSNGASTVTGLTTANSGVLVTNATGVPSILGSMTNGQLVVGSTGNIPVLATITGTTDQVVVTNGAGTITLSSPQSINTTSTPQFARLGLGVAADATNILTATSAATSDLSKTLNISHTGAITTGAGTGYAGYFSKTGASTTNVGLYTTATGATNNYSLQVDSGVAAAGTYTIYANGAAKNYFAGNIGIGDAAPGTSLSVIGNAQIGYTSGQTVSAGTSLAVSGNVGIGTTNPTSPLTVNGSTRMLDQLLFGPVGASTGNITWDANYTYIVSGASKKLSLSVNNALSNSVVIDTNGNVGIGTTGPGTLLDVRGSSSMIGVGNVVPHTDWYTTGYHGLELNGASAVFGNTSGDTFLSSNYYIKSDTNDVRMVTGTAANLYMAGGDYLFRTAPTGNAGTTISWTTPVTIVGASAVANSLYIKAGNVGIGTTGPLAALDVYGVSSMAVLRLHNSDNPYISYYRDATRVGYSGMAGTDDHYIVNEISGGNIRLTTTGTGNVLINNGNVLVGSLTDNGGGARVQVTGGLTTTGNVGIGTTSITSKLGVLGNLAIGGTYGALSAPAGGAIIEGNVGIGTTAPGELLQIGDTPSTAAKQILFRNTTGITYMGVDNSVGNQTSGQAYGSFIWNVGATPISFGTTNLARMTILSTGNVGIGTTGPDSDTLLSLNRTSGTSGISFMNAGAIKGYIGVDVTAANLISTSVANDMVLRTATNMLFSVGSSEKMRILSNGNVGIGTTNPGYKLEVGSASVTGIVARFVNVSGSCDINPTTTALVCPSDINLKKNITTIKDDKEFALQTVPTDTASKSTFDKLMTLTPIKYNWKTEPDTATKHVGFIAQEVEQIFPDLVFTDPVTGTKSLATTNLLPYTVEAIQEMNLKLGEIGDMSKPNIFRAAISSWLENSSNKITRIFTGEICLTDTDGQTECINRSELKQLKGLMNTSGTASVVAPNTSPTPSEPTDSSVSTVITPTTGSAPSASTPTATPTTTATTTPTTTSTITPTPAQVVESAPVVAPAPVVDPTPVVAPVTTTATTPTP